MGWNWYGVKTFYRTTARGRPRVADPDFEPDTIGLEERVVVFRARSEKEAARKARREARNTPL